MDRDTIADAVNKAKEKDKVMSGMADTFKEFMTASSRMAMQIALKDKMTPEEVDFTKAFTRFSLDMLKGIFLVGGDKNAK